MAPPPLRVFILDDHALVRCGLREMLESEGFHVVGDAGLAADATRQIAQLCPDVAILDARLTDGTGIEVCRDVRSIDPSRVCLILSSHADDHAQLGATLAGAAGYVLKEILGTGLSDRIRRAAAGEMLLDPVAARRLVAGLTTSSPLDSPQAGLTAQERRVLSLIGEGLTNAEVGDRMVLTEATVRSYVASLLEKLGFQRRTRPAVAAETGRSEHRS